MNHFIPMETVWVGHSTHPQEATGCTVIVFPQGGVAGVDVRGAAPGTRETDLLRPMFMIRQIHAIVLTGGSAFGLRTADGVMQYLAEKGIGYPAREFRIPIVPAAVIFDLQGDRSIKYPSVEMGYQAAQAAASQFTEGLVGVGRGATVGKILGMNHAMKGGFAAWQIRLPGEVVVGAMVVVNALGDVVNPQSGRIIAGARDPSGKGFLDTLTYMHTHTFPQPFAGSNTTLAVVVTNAQFDKELMNKIAQMGQNGIARTIRPAHTMFDGDVVFAVSVGKKKADVNVVGSAAAQAVENAIVRAVQLGNGLIEK